MKDVINGALTPPTDFSRRRVPGEPKAKRGPSRRLERKTMRRLRPVVEDLWRHRFVCPCSICAVERERLERAYR